MIHKYIIYEKPLNIDIYKLIFLDNNLLIV